MDEMKPKDVMRALECCSNDECSGVCPYDDGELNCDGCTTHLMKDALALLREKDTKIAKAQAIAVEMGKLHQQVLAKVIFEKDAEIERLKHILESYALQYGTARDKEYFLDKARDEAITEFAERIVKSIHPEYPISACQVYRIAKEMKGDQRE